MTIISKYLIEFKSYTFQKLFKNVVDEYTRVACCLDHITKKIHKMKHCIETRLPTTA